MIHSSACPLRQADPFPAQPGRHGKRRSYTTSRDIIRTGHGLVLTESGGGYLEEVSNILGELGGVSGISCTVVRLNISVYALAA